jgi:hypothetical protein
MHKALGELAKKYGLAKFIALDAHDADSSYDSIALPTILAYKAGELTCNLTHIMSHIEKIATCSFFEPEDVEAVLERYSNPLFKKTRCLTRSI